MLRTKRVILSTCSANCSTIFSSWMHMTLGTRLGCPWQQPLKSLNTPCCGMDSIGTDTRGHDCAYVRNNAWAWPRPCVHTRVRMIAPMWEDTRGHDPAMWANTRGHDRAYVCRQVLAWSRLCEKIRVGMIAPMWADTRGHDWWAWLRLWVKTRVGRIAPMCADTHGHDCTYVRRHVWAWLCLCEKTRVGIIAPVCADTRWSSPLSYASSHDSAYVCIYNWSW